jgi:CBS domain-containing protein
MTIGKICQREVHLADLDESTLAAAQRMRETNVGTLIVLDENKKPVGILTDRDLVLRVMAVGRSPERTRVLDVMTAHPRTVTAQTPIEDVVAAMRTLGVRRMPVVTKDGRLVGIVSLDDVLALLAEELGGLGRIFEHSKPNSTLPVRPAGHAGAD